VSELDYTFNESFLEYLKAERRERTYYFYMNRKNVTTKFNSINFYSNIKGSENLYILNAMKSTFPENEEAEIFNDYFFNLVGGEKIDFNIGLEIINLLYNTSKINGIYPENASLSFNKGIKDLFNVQGEKPITNNRYRYNYTLTSFLILNYNLYERKEKLENRVKLIDVEFAVINENGILKPAISFQWFFMKGVYREYTIPMDGSSDYVIEYTNGKRKIIKVCDFQEHINVLSRKIIYNFASKHIEGVVNEKNFLKLPHAELLYYVNMLNMMCY